jgi:hypothetical protein
MGETPKTALAHHSPFPITHYQATTIAFTKKVYNPLSFVLILIDIYTYPDIFMKSLKIKNFTNYERFKIFQPIERVFLDGRSSYADQR